VCSLQAGHYRLIPVHKAAIKACAGQFAMPPVTLLKTKVKLIEKSKEAIA
jgi:hypothetical protein